MNDHITAFISMGSNSSRAIEKMNEAILSLKMLPNLEIARISPIFHTEPQDRRDQPWFYNLAIMVDLRRSWTAQKFLNAMHEIETKAGRWRERETRYGPRPLDMDLITFGEEQSSNPSCLLPHPKALSRAFVLVPMLTIAPAAKISGHGMIESLAKLRWKLNGWKIWQSDSL